jgi:hypothetical protein
MMEREYAVVPFEPMPVARSGDVVHQYGPNPFFEHAMMSFSGVLCGQPAGHRARDRVVRDRRSRPPIRGPATTMDDINVVIRTFYAVIPKSNQPFGF